DVMSAMLANQAANWFASGEAPGRVGNAHPNLVPYQLFATADGALVLAVGNQGQYQAFCRAAGAEGLASDPRFATNADRIAHRAELVAELAPLFATRTTQDWIAVLEAAGVPCGPINTIDQVFAEPQAEARGLTIEMARADMAAPIRMVRSPLRLSKTPPVQDRAPPILGADTDEVLARRLGLDAERLAALRDRGAIS
ncbi:CaiB/BaiF CoA transferase family protein, partial [Mycobacterium tuberculosis]